MPVGGMAWGWSKQGLHAMPLSLLCPIHHSPQLVNSPQIHYQPSASFSKIFFHLSMIYCPLPPSYSLEIPSSALSSSSPLLCLWPFQPSAGSPRAAVSIVRLNSSRASSLRRPQCAASVLPSPAHDHVLLHRDNGLRLSPASPLFPPLAHCPACRPIRSSDGAARHCARTTEEPARPGHQLDNGQLWVAALTAELWAHGLFSGESCTRISVRPDPGSEGPLFGRPDQTLPKNCWP